jgi:hypothetical protein
MRGIEADGRVVSQISVHKDSKLIIEYANFNAVAYADSHGHIQLQALTAGLEADIIAHNETGKALIQENSRHAEEHVVPNADNLQH